MVPGSASGSMDGVALKPLTVDFHEPGFAATLAGENAQPFWFQMSGQQRQQAGYQGGPLNPQALNRYSYVQNNPMRWTDPSGHCLEDACIGEAALAFVFGAVGITLSAPAIAAIAVVLTAAAVAVFLNDPNNRAWLSEQINNGIGNVTAFADSLVGKINGTANDTTYEKPSNVLEAKETRKSGKEQASDAPSWLKGQRKKPGESGKDAAKRVMDERYGKGNYKTGPGSEYNKAQKYFDRKQ